MKVSILPATEADAPAIAAVRNAAAADLTRLHGRGHWSSDISEPAVVRSIKTSRVLAARHGREIVGTLRLVTKKPWAIDKQYFMDVARPLYLLDMAVTPLMQRKGVGRQLVQQALTIAAAWPSQAIRLDAYDAPAGAGGFYAKCGFREVARVEYRGVPLIYYERLIDATGS
jgi:GNAT superfamily N-acetyltransferase